MTERPEREIGVEDEDAVDPAEDSARRRFHHTVSVGEVQPEPTRREIIPPDAAQRA